MKKTLHIIITLLFLFTTFTIKANDRANLKMTRVTHLANSGFMVTVGCHKIMFNGLFNDGQNKYMAPDEYTISLIKKGAHPFDDIDIVFISNYQTNHFDPYIATQFMLNNQHVKLVCPQQVINKIITSTNDYSKIKNRIIETTPIANHYDYFLINDYEIFACNIRDEKLTNCHIENIGYVVTIEGVKIFHSGDSGPETLDDLYGLNLAELNIDIAFLSDKFVIGSSVRKTNKLVDARYNVLMHFEKFVKPKTLDNFVSRRRLRSNAHIFKVRNEYQDFYVNDYLVENIGGGLNVTLSQR